MSSHLLTKAGLVPGMATGRDNRPVLRLLESLAFVQARVHEITGPARRVLALLLAAQTEGPVIWIRPVWLSERLFPDGVQPLCDPSRLLEVTPGRPDDLLWCTEEALRAGAAALVVTELGDLPGLTPVRRLHLAAETGAAEGQVRPTGLLLTPAPGGAPGVESRWHMRPGHGPDRTAWRLARTRARQAPPAEWDLVDHGRGLRLSPATAAPVPV